MLPDKFVAGTIIAKLPPSWNNFATSLKHKRHEFSVADLIGTLDVEEKARAKDTRARVAEGGSSAHMVQKKNSQPNKYKNNKNKTQGKGKFDTKNKDVKRLLEDIEYTRASLVNAGRPSRHQVVVGQKT